MTSGPGVRALARVSSGAISRNVERLRTVAGTDLCAVVKGDGYGHGATESARAALRGGATWLAVATALEARALREDRVDARLLVLGALTPAELEIALDADADVVAWTTEFAEAAQRRNGRVHVKLDTGMGRLGTRDPALATQLADGLGDNLAGLMTHFATADELGDHFFGEQLQRFEAWVAPLRDRHPQAVVHAANSAAVLRAPAACGFDLVRTGVAIYGLDPFQHDPADHDLEPAMELLSTVAAAKPIAPGESAGYGRRYVATQPGTIATIPIGYADGYRRGLTNSIDVLVAGRRSALVGTVSMDNVTALAPDAVVGDEVVLIGSRGDERILAEDLARALGTINYEVTCALTARVGREHVP